MKGIPREVEVLKRRTVTNSRQIRSLREKFALSSYQKSVLIGTLLGDGGLYREGWAKNFRLQLSQGANQKDYLFWKYDVFRNCCVSGPAYQENNNAWRIRSISHPEFNAYAKKFYYGKTKIVPWDLRQHLEPLSLAVWFMDDGSRGPKDGYTLNSQSFTLEENKRLQSYLQKRFSLQWVSLHRDKQWWRLYIRGKSTDDFERLVRPHIIPAMQYKLQLLTP